MNSYTRAPSGPVFNRSLNMASRLRPVSPLAPQASEPVKLAFWVQWLAAMTVQLSLLLWLTWDKTADLSPAYRSLAVISLLGSIPVYAIFRTFSIYGGYLVGLGRLLAGWSTLLAVMMAIAFITKTSEDYSRQVISIWATVGFVLQGATFLPLHKLFGTLDAAINSSRRS